MSKLLLDFSNTAATGSGGGSSSCFVEEAAEERKDTCQYGKLAGLFEDFLEYGNVGLHIVDNRGIILWANQTELDLLGYSAHEYIGKPISDFHVDPSKLQTILTTLLAGKQVINTVAPIRAKDGHTEYVEINSSMRRDQHGKCVTTRCFSARVTDRVLRQRAELEAVERKRKAELVQEETHRKTEFLRHLCHELRNPLAGVTANLELLLDDLKQAQRELVDLKNMYMSSAAAAAAREEQQDKLVGLEHRLSDAVDFAQHAQLAAEHQSLVINDTLSLSRLEGASKEQAFEFAPVPVSINAELESCRAILGVKAKERQIDLNVHVMALEEQAALPVFVKTDQVWFRQVLLNLLSNALKFTDTNGRVDVRVSTTATDKAKDTTNLQIEVQDTGIGMSPEEQSKLFGLFAQANASICTKFGGSGLGLHIVKKFLDHIGGTITCQSQKGVGTTFCVKMPCGTVTEEQRKALLVAEQEKESEHHKVVKNPSTAAASTGSTISSTSTSTTSEIQQQQPSSLSAAVPSPSSSSADSTGLQDKRVLLVEDCSINRKVVAAFLRRTGVQHELAEHGQQGLDLHLKQPFDLILTDTNMPVMDGHAMTERIRTHEQSRGLPRVPIVGISGNALPQDVLKAKSVGVDELVSKPYKFPALEALMRQYLLAATATVATAAASQQQQ